MTKYLELDYSHSYILEGFRKNDAFIENHKECLDMLSDKIWRDNKYMNTEKNISSPTRTILSRYTCNILSSLFIDISKNSIEKLIVTCESRDDLDIYSKYIFSVVEKTTDVAVDFINCEKSRCETRLTPNNMRTQVKRGLYDQFLCENSDLNWIYNYYKSVYNGVFCELRQLIQQYCKVKDKYEKWLFIKAIINQGIRQNEKEVVEFFLKQLKDNNQGIFDYINSFSFYLLKFYSKDKSRIFLEEQLDIDDFLGSDKEDYARSLVFKNYASLLPDTSELKRNIMEKCLSQTPQDTDLWKEWFETYANQKEIRQKATEIFKHGYSDISLLKLVKIEPDDTESLIRMIILCTSDLNSNIARYLISFLSDGRLKEFLELFVENFDFLNIIEGKTSEINF
ncbi:hypothetical protein RK421_06635 [Streptococcus pneumoniae]|nr:hypothetical protein [Streptococcus pneumoniae]